MSYTPPTKDELRKIFHALKLTNVEAAVLVGMTPRQIRRYTSGESRMPFPVLYTLINRASPCEVGITTGNWRRLFYLENIGPMS